MAKTTRTLKATSGDGRVTRRQFTTSVDLSREKRTQLIQRLNQQLADTSDLFSQVKQAHWNVKGRAFYSLHTLFDEIAGELLGYIDDLAERITALGGYAMGTNRSSAAHSRLPEYPSDITDGPEHVRALASRLGLVANHVREAIDEADELEDAGTADLLTGMSRLLDKRLWFLEAHLQDSENEG